MLPGLRHVARQRCIGVRAVTGSQFIGESGHDMYAPRLMVSSQVCLTGYPAVVCRYAIRAGVLGRSSVLTWRWVVTHCGCVRGYVSLLLSSGTGRTLALPLGGMGRTMGGVGAPLCGGAKGAGCCWGTMFTCHNRGPAVSQVPWRILCPWL